ncbi:MAG TPA: hypothetical protein VM146_04575 [Steroidobacteraceae bacterium]|nr:hypothetical protein [Steroidobacteraceae bacterium]
MKARLLIALAVAGVVAPAAQACSCLQLTGTPEEQVRQSLDDADAVFVARLKRSALRPETRTDGHRRDVIEDAQFEIIEVFKGALQVGQVIRVYQVLSAGSCGQSSTNDPPWMYAASKPGAEQLPVKFSKEWLIYSHGTPIELGRCTRSSPINVEGGQDVKILRGLKRQKH